MAFFVRNLAAHAQIVTEAPTTYYLFANYGCYFAWCIGGF